MPLVGQWDWQRVAQLLQAQCPAQLCGHHPGMCWKCSSQASLQSYGARSSGGGVEGSDACCQEPSRSFCTPIIWASCEKEAGVAVGQERGLGVSHFALWTTLSEPSFLGSYT